MRSLAPVLAFVAALSLLAPPAAARDDTYGGASSYDQTTEAEELLTEELAGDPNKEVKAELYTIPAKTTLPWHIHPSAQEIVYVVDGPFAVEVEGQGEGEDKAVERTELKTGDVFHLDPNAVHRGMNEHETDAARLYVIRIKPKAAPLVEEVDR